MAVRAYYGTCKTAEGVSEKQVYVPDMDLAEEDFNFIEGDLLIVFFAQTNTVSEPSIVINIQDTEQESSTTSDSGKLIKSLDVAANMENAWAAGETVIFAYTQKGTTSNYYWELVDANHASKDTYGNTKLFDENNLETLLTEAEDDAENSEIALTPNALKRFFNLLNGIESGQKEDEGGEGGEGEGDESEDPVLRVIGLNWTPAIEEDTQDLGTLSLTGDSTNGIQITYPFDSRVQSLIQESIPFVPQFTGQLINNGNGKDGETAALPEEGAEPFITRMIPNDLYFNSTNGLYYGTPEDRKNIININDGTLTVGNDILTGGIVLDKFTTINGNVQTNGNLTTTGAISAGASQISTSGAIKSSVLYEGFNGSTNEGTKISDIYSKKLIMHEAKSGSISIKTTNPFITSTFDAKIPSNYTPLGVMGYNITNASTSGYGASYCLPYAMILEGTNVRYNLRNINTARDVKVQITCYILCVAK